MKKIKTLIVDDEPLARERLATLLANEPDIEIVAQCRDGEEAVTSVHDHAPDLMFLDVQMPQMNGFEVIDAVGPERMPLVIFVTAYDQHAIAAFDVNAVDYLLKPVEPNRLETTVDRVRRRIHSERPGGRPAGELDKVLHLLGDRQDLREQLALKVGDRFLLIQADEVVHASVEDDVITVETNSLSGTSNYRTLDELQAHLDPTVFWRVHRSHLVNINKIKEIVPWFSRNFLLKMRDPKGTEIPVSRSQTKRLREYLRL